MKKSFKLFFFFCAVLIVPGLSTPALAAIPAIPTLISPANNANVAGTSVNLSWSASTGATQYWLWVRRTSDNVVVISQNIGNNTSYNLTGLINNGDNYFWMVRAGNSGGWSTWPAARRFYNGTSAIPAPPVLISPAVNANAAGTSVNLSWSASTGATQYWLWVRRTSDSVIIFNQNVGNQTSYTLTGLPKNGKDYFWMVRAGNSGGWSTWPAARRFYNGTAAIPAIPTLISPANNAKVAGTSVNLSWSASSGATQYWLWARRTSDNLVIFSQNIGNRTSYALTGLPNNGSDYFWMVRAGNSSGWSTWPAARRFYTSAVSVHSDNDGDGFTSAQGDCNDSYFGLRPGAPEICEDGIDQDCDGQDRSCRLLQFTSSGTYVHNSGILTLHTAYSDFPGDEGLPLGITNHPISQITTTALIVPGEDYDSTAWVRKSGLPDNLVGVWTPMKTEGLEKTELRFQSDNTFTYMVKEVAWITQNKTITIDGDFSDWTEQDRIYIDNDGPDCNNARGQDIREIYIARDKGFIYLRYVLNAPMDETFGYKFGSDQRHIYVSQINASGRIFYGSAYGQPQPNLPQEFLKINGNQFECKFYVTDIESWKNIRWLSAWLDQGVQTQCRDRVVMVGLDLGL